MGINANRTEPISKGVKMNIIAQLSTAIRRVSANSPDIIYNDAKLHHFLTHKKSDNAGCSTFLAAAFKPESFPVECNIPCDSMVYGDFSDRGNFFIEALSTHTPIKRWGSKTAESRQ